MSGQSGSLEDYRRTDEVSAAVKSTRTTARLAIIKEIRQKIDDMWLDSEMDTASLSKIEEMLSSMEVEEKEKRDQKATEESVRRAKSRYGDIDKHPYWKRANATKRTQEDSDEKDLDRAPREQKG
jgi:hypothetical protein